MVRRSEVEKPLVARTCSRNKNEVDGLASRRTLGDAYRDGSDDSRHDEVDDGATALRGVDAV